MEKGQRSLLFNQITWDVSHLGERTLLLQARSDISIADIHHTSHLIREAAGEELRDIVPAYDSIALFYQQGSGHLLERLATARDGEQKSPPAPGKVEVPVCYELGPDLEEVSGHAGLSKEEWIALHLSGTYRSVLIGFTPGFIYMDGLDKRLACPRKANPRTRLEPGSIGIGGHQTGIYSLDSPGGWNIIGRTPLRLFNPEKTPPVGIEPITIVTFYRISKAEFDAWES